MTDLDLDVMLKRLHLANARRVWRELAERAEKEQWTYDHLLKILFAEEVAHRAQTRLNRLSHAAKFPFFKTIDDFDFTFQTTLRMSMFGTFLSPDFVSQGGSLVLSGKPGRGKTHLAVAVAYRAIQNGFDALFTTAAALIDDLSVAARDGLLRDALAKYVQPSVLVIDELGYLTYGSDAANVLFHIVNERHLKKRAMVITTNKSLKAWGAVLHDPDLAEAIVDRLLERGRVVQLDGPSIRSKHVDPAALDGGVPPAIISGTDLPDFPEPTVRKGSKGVPVVFWKPLVPCGQDSDSSHDEQDSKRCGPVLARQFFVFNVADCDGIPESVHDLPRDESLASRIVHRSGARIVPGEPCYRPDQDVVQLPPASAFSSEPEMYAVACHELVHWTGTRLGREQKAKRFGDDAHAMEELVAELGSAMLCGACGFAPVSRAASYLDHWIRVLRQDSRAIFTVASAAQTAADYLLERAEEDAPVAGASGV